MPRGHLCPVTIRGVTYPSRAAAGRALGVSPECIGIATKRGTLHRVGLGFRNKEPMRVRIAGQCFKDAREAAKAFGCTREAVYRAISDGDPDRIARTPRETHSPAARPVVLGGLRFPSMAAASRALGFHHAHVATVLRGGSRARRERLLAAAMAYARRQEAA